METPEMYDLLVLVDATASMGNYLDALRSSLPKIIALSTLTSCFSRIGVLAYRDYCQAGLLEWSGWMHPNEPQLGDINSAELLRKTERLRATGGGDYPEATKTALAQMYMLMRKDATTVVLLYTDAPPHASAFADWGEANTIRELEALKHEDSFGGDGSKFMDWVSACKFLQCSEKRLQIFCFLSSDMDEGLSGHYIYLSTIVQGATFYLEDYQPNTISHVTVEVLLSWMGAEKAGSDQRAQIPARMARYKSVAMLKTIKDEEDASAELFFLHEQKACVRKIQRNVAETDVTAELLKRCLPTTKKPVQDLAQRYTKDLEFKKVVREQLAWIIETDVAAISLNPVFGSLWRAVCNDRGNKLVRDELTTKFSYQVDRITDIKEKTRMKTWLEESYDYTAEVLEMIAALPAEKRFPCVLLDPTLSFEEARMEGNNDDLANRPITDFQRDELLEIGRSCDYKILRRLGRILTRLTFVNSAAELSAHIAATDDKTVPKIPLALAKKEYGSSFWKILLHIVVPGTMLSARPAALLCALAIKMGVQPFYEAADREMMIWRGRWNDLEIPETWNTNCLSLLLDADKAYRQRKESTSDTDRGGSKPFESLLKDEDRELFDRLVSYKLVEFNLHTTLTARVGLTPEKTIMPVGPLIICKSCDFPRSVTIMAPHGICGLCKASDYSSKEHKQKTVSNRVTKEDTEATNATWVECNIRTCRAQYVVYGVEDLQVKPKCHYCRGEGSLSENRRNESSAPWLECQKCLNRVIWPEEYRKEFVPIHCAACSNGRATMIDLETSAEKISKENGTGWLLRNQDRTIEEPFNRRSLFYTISKAGIDKFCANVELFPVLPKGEASNLTFNGKLIHNIPELKSQLQSWIDRRAAEKVHCSLCFSEYRKEFLRPACGRSGCHQRICADCLASWYGLNSSGHIINTAALACPFCRRTPSAKTLSAYGMGIHAVGNLKTAVEEKGEWIYGWCHECSQAKRHMERVCAAGAPPDLIDFTCETCVDTSVALATAEAERLAVELAATEDAVRVADLMERLERAQRKRAAALKPIKTKKCPGCGTLTEKVSGCDHMQCVVRSCAVHWCWGCGDAFGADEIYRHMENAHGGYYGDFSDDDDEEGEY